MSTLAWGLICIIWKFLVKICPTYVLKGLDFSAGLCVLHTNDLNPSYYHSGADNLEYLFIHLCLTKQNFAGLHEAQINRRGISLYQSLPSHTPCMHQGTGGYWPSGNCGISLLLTDVKLHQITRFSCCFWDSLS